MVVKILDFHMYDYSSSTELGGLKITLGMSLSMCSKLQEENGKEGTEARPFLLGGEVSLSFSLSLFLSSKYMRSMAKTWWWWWRGGGDGNKTKTPLNFMGRIYIAILFINNLFSLQSPIADLKDLTMHLQSQSVT